jgi:predicted secreted protein
MRKFLHFFKVPAAVQAVVLALAMSLGLHLGTVHADPTYTVNGVFSVNSTPVPNARVQYNGAPGFATTDANGNYTLANVPAGNYSISVSYSPPNPPVGSTVPYIFNASSNGTYATVSGDMTKNIDFNIGTQTVHVVDTNGNPVVNANVQMAGGSSVWSGANYTFSDGYGTNFTGYQMYGFGYTDANGDVHMPVAEGLTYNTCVYTSVSLCQSKTPAGGSTSIVMTLPSVGTVSGVFTVNGNPVPNATVQVSGSPNATTDATGHYSIPNVNPGPHSMYIGYSPPNPPVNDSVPYIFGVQSAGGYITVDGDQTKNLTFNVGTQTVHVVDADGTVMAGLGVTMAGGSSVFNHAGYTYNVPDANGAIFGASLMYGTVMTDANGDARIPVAAGLTYNTCAGSTCLPETPVSGVTTNFTVPVTLPSAPYNLTATTPSSAPVLNWHGSPGATHYKVYRDGTAIATVTQTTYTDTTAPSGTHSYRVTATNSAGESGFSNTVSNIVVDSTPPVVTVTPVAGSTLSGSVTFNITVSDNAALNPAKNKSVWVYLYNTAGAQKSVGAKVDLSSGSGSFTVDTTKLVNGNANLDVGIVYDAIGNASGVHDNYFRNYTINN